MEDPPGHAFISYVREDSDRVDELQRYLTAAGIPVWRDTADLWPGQNWRTMIRRAITDNALVFIACFSSQSLAKKKTYQNEELALAIEQLRLRQPDDPWLIPIRFDDCPVPDLDIGAGRTLGSIQRADLFGHRREEGMKRLVTFIRGLLMQASPSEDTRAERAEPSPRTAAGASAVRAAENRRPMAVRPPARPAVASAHRGQLMGAQRQAGVTRPPASFRVEVLSKSEWSRLRDIRLSALRDQPEAFLPRYEDEAAYSVERWRQEFLRGEWNVMLAGERVVGLLGVTREPAMSSHECYLEYLWVAPGFRRHGGASLLLRSVLDRLKDSGVHTVWLYILDGNENAMRLYQRFGFQRTNEWMPLPNHPAGSEERMKLRLY